VQVVTYIADMDTHWWSVAGQLLASVVILLSVYQDLGLRARVGAALGSFMAAAFGISALVSAVRANFRSGAAICVLVLFFETGLILRWLLRRKNKRDLQ
jgi:preprotein translocase subunit SecG